MSTTYVAAIANFLILLGVLSQEEATVLSEGLIAVVSLVVLLVTLYGRFTARKSVDIFGRYQKD